MTRFEERDDIDSLPIPKAAKSYARRSGLASMKDQPKQFQAVNAMITNPGKKDKFQNYTAGETTGGKNLSKGQPNAMKEAAENLVDHLFGEADRFSFTTMVTKPRVYQVYAMQGEKPVLPNATVYAIQMPNGRVNTVEIGAEDNALNKISDRLRQLVTSGRGFVNGDTIITPWTYLKVSNAQNGQLELTTHNN